MMDSLDRWLIGGSFLCTLALCGLLANEIERTNKQLTQLKTETENNFIQTLNQMSNMVIIDQKVIQRLQQIR